MRLLKLISCLIVISVAFASNSLAQQYSFRSYNIREGLPQSQVHCLLQENKGYLWIGTIGGGLSRFDGRRFKNFGIEEGLPSNKILSLEFCNDLLWVGTEKGLRAFNGSEFLNVFPDEIQVDFLQSGAPGQIWLGSNKGLYLLNCTSPENPQVTNILASKPIFALADSKNGIWVAVNGKIYHYSDDGKIIEELSTQNGVVNALYEDKEGVLWIGFYSKGIAKKVGASVAVIAGQEDKTAHCFYETEPGSLWIGTLDEGLHILNTETMHHIVLDDRNGLPNNQVKCILKDRWENIWVGTYGGGLARYYGAEVRHLNKDSGLPGRQVYSIIEGPDSLIWMGVADKGLIRYDPTNARITQDSALYNVKVKSLFKDQQGRIWAGTEGNGLQIYDADTTWNIDEKQGLIAPWVKNIKSDNRGRVWLALSGGGIARIENAFELNPFQKAEIYYFNQANSNLAHDRVNVLCVDRLQRVWYGTESGGFGLVTTEDQIINFGKEQGLKNIEIKSLIIDRNNWLWIGTGEGFCRIDLNQSEFKIEYPPSQFQPKGGYIYLMQQDQNGAVWAGDQTGVYRLNTDAQGAILDIKHYGQRDGFEGIETCMNSSVLDSRGRLWFGTIDGINCISTEENISPNKSAPSAFVSGISLFYQPLNETPLKSFLNSWGGLKDTLILTYEQNHLSFDFAGIHLGDPEGVLFQWKLSGLDTSWTPPMPLNNATFSNLKPGSYSLLMRACISEEICSQTSSVPFVILQPYWQKTWFIWASVLAVALLVVSIFMIILKSTQRRSREKNAKLLMEKKLIELEQKSLRLQMNPHFVFNTLNSIQGLIATEDYKGARQQLSRFSKLMRQILENSREEKVMISEEIEALRNYLELEKSTRADIFEFEIISEVDPETLEIPPLLVQPFAENAIIHGLAPLGKGGKLVIAFKENNGNLDITIEDNGIGRKAAREKNKSAVHHKSAGLAVTEERLELLAGKSETQIHFEDLYNDKKEAIGTRVRIKIPLNLLRI